MTPKNDEIGDEKSIERGRGAAAERSRDGDAVFQKSAGYANKPLQKEEKQRRNGEENKSSQGEKKVEKAGDVGAKSVARKIFRIGLKIV